MLPPPLRSADVTAQHYSGTGTKPPAGATTHCTRVHFQTGTDHPCGHILRQTDVADLSPDAADVTPRSGGSQWEKIWGLGRPQWARCEIEWYVDYVLHRLCRTCMVGQLDTLVRNMLPSLPLVLPTLTIESNFCDTSVLGR